MRLHMTRPDCYNSISAVGVLAVAGIQRLGSPLESHARAPKLQPNPFALSA